MSHGAAAAGMDAAVKARVSGFRLRKERQSEFVALASVHGRASQQPSSGEAATAALDVRALQSCRSFLGSRRMCSLFRIRVLDGFRWTGMCLQQNHHTCVASQQLWLLLKSCPEHERATCK